MSPQPYPQPSFAHLIRLSDDTGLLEHAQGAVSVTAAWLLRR